MGTKQEARDPLPESFASLEEAAEFWDRHDVTDYEDLTTEAHFDVDLQRRGASPEGDVT